MSSANEAIEQWMGRRLHVARKQSGMTLTTAAGHVGVSAAHLSRLEKGERQPSIGVLLELVRLYQTSIGELLGEEPGTSYHLTRADSTRTIDSPDGPYAALSGLGYSARLRAARLELPPGRRNPRAAQHEGEEWLYVINGEIELNVNGEPLKLATGDAAHFQARHPHRLANISSKEAASVLIVSTPAANHPNSPPAALQ